MSSENYWEETEKKIKRMTHNWDSCELCMRDFQFQKDKAQHEKEMNRLKTNKTVNGFYENDLQQEISELKKKIEELEMWTETQKFANDWGCELLLYNHLKEKLKELFEK